VQQFNQDGVPLAGGQVFTYLAGTTSPAITYTSASGATANENPIILDANGQCTIWFTGGVSYKLVLSPATDTNPPTNPFWTADDLWGVNDPTVGQ